MDQSFNHLEAFHFLCAIRDGFVLLESENGRGHINLVFTPRHIEMEAVSSVKILYNSKGFYRVQGTSSLEVRIVNEIWSIRFVCSG
jgi:hypothetical protein